MVLESWETKIKFLQQREGDKLYYLPSEEVLFFGAGEVLEIG